ncbi:MAG: hypothetical protein WAW80_02665 [Candidatus Saccharimonadales bacterium]
MIRIIVAVVLSLVVSLLPVSVGASEATNIGLSISPLRRELTVTAGKTTTSNFTVANLTKEPMTVNFSVKQFSTTNFVYDYEFRPPDNDWVKIQVAQIKLKPGEGKKVNYTVNVPDRTSPGGYYYTMFASTDIASGLPSTVQAATLLYLTVDGKLIRTSVLQNDSIPFLVTGNEVPYKFDVKNLGNVHFSAYFYGQLESVFGKGEEIGTSHLVMPGTVRSVNGSIPTPLLPGVYRATYGYKVDFADFLVSKTAYVVFIPPWSVVATFFILLSGRWLWQKRRDKMSKKED